MDCADCGGTEVRVSIVGAYKNSVDVIDYYTVCPRVFFLTVTLGNRKTYFRGLKYMRGSRKFCQRGSNLDIVFLVDEGREDPSTTISGLSMARQRNAIKWRFAGVLMMAQHGMLAWQLRFFRGSGPVSSENPYFL